jgi:hypothetical protein
MEAQGGNPTAAMWPAHFSEKLPGGREALHSSCASKGDVSSNIACQQLLLQCGPLSGVVVGNAKTALAWLRANPLRLVHFDPCISDREGLYFLGTSKNEESPADH